jgi:hypothetical protein
MRNVSEWRKLDDNIIFQIKTPDNKLYFPDNMAHSYELDFNTVPIEYANRDGAFVVRGKIGFRIFDISIVFQGSAHIEDHDKFIKSISGEGNCVVTHPYYGAVKGKFGKIKVSHDKLNITSITCSFYESIINESPYPQPVFTEVSNIEVGKIVSPGKVSKASMAMSKIAAAKAATAEALNDIISATDRAERLLNTIGTDAERFMSNIAYIARSIGRMQDTVRNRITNLREAYRDVKGALAGAQYNLSAMAGLERGEKKYFESIGSHIMQSGIYAMNTGPASTRGSLAWQADTLQTLVSDYLEVLNAMQQPYGDISNRYMPDAESAAQLAYSAAQAISNARFKMDGATEQKRHIVVNDTALRPLVYQLTGEYSEEALDNFIALNDISKEEAICLKAGREVFYAG